MNNINAHGCQNVPMTSSSSSVVAILEELQSQGLSVSMHDAHNGTWFIKGEGIFQGYVATSEELIELKEMKRLDLRGIKSLG